MTTTFDTLKATTRLAASDGGSTARSVDAPLRIAEALRGAHVSPDATPVPAIAGCCLFRRT